MRIVAGKFRGRSLIKSDHLKSLRPTTDRNREALFNILSSAKFARESGFEITNAEVLDLCCGTGAVGFEALSRGAKSVVFIDNNRTHLDVVAQNSKILQVEKETKILCADAKNLPQNNKNFDLIFIDPPYAEDYLSIMSSLLNSGWVSKNSLVVSEFQSNKSVEEASTKDFELLELRSYGKSSFAFLRLS